MKRIYKYVELSPRGFANEIEFVVACENKEHYDEIINLYMQAGTNRKVFDIKHKDIKKRYVTNSSDIIEALKHGDNSLMQALSNKQYYMNHVKF